MPRYTEAEKRNIVQYAKKHTYKETTEQFGVSEMSIARWMKEFPDPNKKNDSSLYKQKLRELYEYMSKYTKITKAIEQSDIEFFEEIEEMIK